MRQREDEELEYLRNCSQWITFIGVCFLLGLLAGVAALGMLIKQYLG